MANRKIRFKTLTVRESGDSFFEDLLEDDLSRGGEWRLNITVGDKTQSWSRNNVVPRNYRLGLTFFVNPGEDEELNISIGGIEEDRKSKSDEIPPIEVSYGPEENWGVGRWKQSASSRKIDYTISYEISKA